MELHTKRLLSEHGVADVNAAETRLRQLKKKVDQHAVSLEQLEAKAEKLVEALEQHVS